MSSNSRVLSAAGAAISPWKVALDQHLVASDRALNPATSTCSHAVLLILCSNTHCSSNRGLEGRKDMRCSSSRRFLATLLLLLSSLLAWLHLATLPSPRSKLIHLVWPLWSAPNTQTIHLIRTDGSRQKKIDWTILSKNFFLICRTCRCLEAITWKSHTQNHQAMSHTISGAEECRRK